MSLVSGKGFKYVNETENLKYHGIDRNTGYIWRIAHKFGLSNEVVNDLFDRLENCSSNREVFYQIINTEGFKDKINLVHYSWFVDDGKDGLYATADIVFVVDGNGQFIRKNFTDIYNQEEAKGVNFYLGFDLLHGKLVVPAGEDLRITHCFHELIVWNEHIGEYLLKKEEEENNV